MAGGYQWPSGSSQFMSQYSPLSSYMSSQPGSSAYPGLTGAQAQQASSMMTGLESQTQGQSSMIPAANSNSVNNGGLLSSASHLIAQYLSPSSAANNQQVPQSASQQNGLQQQNAMQQNGQSSGIMTSQQQSQNQYNEFASILDSMVAQTGVSAQRQPNLNQYLANPSAVQGQQGLQSQSGIQGHQAAPTNMMMGDNEMSGSNNIQSYMPAASQQQANQKSSMVSLAEQLAPGAQFNKLVSFPFSLTSNEDTSKEGRYKLHIPFLNQHVKRSDQQAVAGAAASPVSGQQQQQKYINSYYSQQQPASSLIQSPQQPQQLKPQSSQLVPTIVSPQSSVSQAQSYTNAQTSANAAIPSSASSGSSSSSSSSSASAPSSIAVSSSSSS